MPQTVRKARLAGGSSKGNRVNGRRSDVGGSCSTKPFARHASGSPSWAKASAGTGEANSPGLERIWGTSADASSAIRVKSATADTSVNRHVDGRSAPAGNFRKSRTGATGDRSGKIRQVCQGTVNVAR